MSPSRFTFWAVICLLIAGTSCLADGKVFGPGVGKIPIPDQDAMIVWNGGVETLAIETRFVSSGRDFAWVVPLPAKPEISPGSAGMFPTLRALCAPDVVRSTTPFFPLFTAITIFLLIAMVVTAGSAKRFAIAMALLVPLTCLVLMPSLGRVRGGGEPGPAVEILDRGIIGSYEVTTVASTDPSALAAWLKDNGFTIAPGAQPVIADYVKAGWVFSAAKLRRDQDTTKPSTPHPLVFKFKTDQPVYPLRLTAVENGPLKVDLYVFGPGRAAADGFDVKRCAAAELSDADPYHYHVRRKDRIDISHDGLGALLVEGLTLTRLSGTLSPEQMGADAQIRFSSAGAYQEEFYLSSTAIGLSLNVGTGVLLGCVFIIATATRSASRGRDRAFRAVLVAIGVSCVSGGVSYALTPIVPEAKSTRDARWQELRLRQLAEGLMMEVSKLRGAKGALTLDWARSTARGVWVDLWRGEDPFPQEGDGPGCFSLKMTPEGELEARWYEAFGQMHKIDSKGW